MYTKYKIKTELFAVLQHLGYARHLLHENASLRNDLAMDSLGMLELAGALEMKYKLIISDNSFAELNTINDVVSYLVEQLAEEPVFFDRKLNAVQLLSSVNNN